MQVCTGLGQVYVPVSLVISFEYTVLLLTRDPTTVNTILDPPKHTRILGRHHVPHTQFGTRIAVITLQWKVSDYRA